MILVIHWLGWAVWLGAQLTFMVWGPAARRASLESWAHTWDTLSKVQRWIVAPACAAATLTGLVLSMQYAQRGLNAGAMWMVVMQSFGLLAAIMTLGFATPLVNRVAFYAARSVETGQADPRAEVARKRLALVASISGAFILVVVYFAVLQPGA